MTLSWTNIQFKRRKYFNCFCTDNPGICCCNVIHWSEQWWHRCPFPHNIHVLWVPLSARKPLSENSLSAAFPKCWTWPMSPTAYSIFLGGLQVWDPQPFLIYVPLLVVFFSLRPVCRVSTLSILCRVTRGASSILCSCCLLGSKPEFFQETPCCGAAHGVHLVSY